MLNLSVSFFPHTIPVLEKLRRIPSLLCINVVLKSIVIFILILTDMPVFKSGNEMYHLFRQMRHIGKEIVFRHLSTLFAYQPYGERESCIGYRVVDN
jgi:hypothetical protein